VERPRSLSLAIWFRPCSSRSNGTDESVLRARKGTLQRKGREARGASLPFVADATSNRCCRQRAVHEIAHAEPSAPGPRRPHRIRFLT
jgi:hypothetical protein